MNTETEPDRCPGCQAPTASCYCDPACKDRDASVNGRLVDALFFGRKSKTGAQVLSVTRAGEEYHVVYIDPQGQRQERWLSDGRPVLLESPSIIGYVA